MMSEEGISFILPETCYEVGSRKVRRHSCKGIQVELIQNSVIFNGSLSDFSAVSFSVEVSAEPPQTFQWINPESTVHIIFKKGKDILYSGECKIIRQTLGQKTRTFVLEPISKQMRRFKPKERRSSRHKLLPSPNIIFKHPLTGRLINLKVEDLSGSGFSVEEYYEDSVLLPGMIIPELYIEFANNFKINCKAQVVYRSVNKTYVAEPYAKYGIAILDMDIQDQVKLSSLLHQ
ncbi:MAG: PilZ domain-containing protein, partial [Nitrospira sp.]|nr:PilZ domain-containing protein [Nitrospira sp.]